MFKSKVFYVVLIVLIGAGVLFYRNYHRNKMSDEVAYLMQTTHPNIGPKNTVTIPSKLFGSLIITSGVPNSQDMANGQLCIENSKNLDKVDLFMPDMGHGSEPPKVTPINTPNEFSKYNKTIAGFGCYSVESMQLFMPGLWQVRAFYKDGTVGIFNLDLKK